MKGKIKLIFRNRGYGFIIPEGETQELGDVFFHVRDFKDKNVFEELNTGDELEFELGKNEKGRIALKITKIKGVLPEIEEL